jgi:hypothetical protein
MLLHNNCINCILIAHLLHISDVFSWGRACLPTGRDESEGESEKPGEV